MPFEPVGETLFLPWVVGRIDVVNDQRPDAVDLNDGLSFRPGEVGFGCMTAIMPAANAGVLERSSLSPVPSSKYP
jgi:hypothetical protein